MIVTMDIFQCQSDTFFFKDHSNELFVGVYVYDILVVGLEDKVYSFVNVLKRIFTLTVKKEVNKFVGLSLNGLIITLFCIKKKWLKV